MIAILSLLVIFNNIGFMIIHNEIKLRSILITSIFLFILILQGFTFYYFEFSPKKLIVKNHLFFWYKKEIPIENIKEITTESRWRAPDGLRLVFENYKSKAFLASTYRNADWQNIYDILHRSGMFRA